MFHRSPKTRREIQAWPGADPLGGHGEEVASTALAEGRDEDDEIAQGRDATFPREEKATDELDHRWVISTKTVIAALCLGACLAIVLGWHFRSNAALREVASERGQLRQQHQQHYSQRAFKEKAKMHSREKHTYHAHEKKRRKRHREKLDPAHWETFTYRQLKQYFGCKAIFHKPRPILTKQNWQYLRDLYNQFESQQGVNDADASYKVGSKQHAFPVEGVVTKTKGRGLVAARDIAKGERIFRARTGHSWRMFVWHLHNAPPPGDYADGFACDIMAWSWNQRVPPGDGHLQILTDES